MISFHASLNKSFCNAVQIASSPETNIISKNTQFLLDHLPPGPLTVHLFQEGIVNQNDWDDIEALPTPWKQNSKMIKHILRHPQGYISLMSFLRSAEHNIGWIAEKLSATDT